jgi:hypothetical protein
MEKVVWTLLLCFLTTTATWAGQKHQDASHGTIDIVTIRSSQDLLRVTLKLNNASGKNYHIAVCDSPVRLSELYAHLEVNAEGGWRQPTPSVRLPLDEFTPWWLPVPAGRTVEVDFVLDPASQPIPTGANVRLTVNARYQPSSDNGKVAEADFELVSATFTIPDTSAQMSHSTHESGAR